MFPSIEIAEKELAGELNPGPWTKHSVKVLKQRYIMKNKRDALYMMYFPI